MRLSVPRLVVAGLSGDAGKTLVSLGLVRALVRRGVAVAPFKKGPDYIDAAWLGAAAGRPGRNLDTFLMDDAALGRTLESASGAALAVVEGNRGLFDGVDAGGTHSTATLAKKLGAPVLLVVDVTKTTRTAAALVLGCQAMDPELRIAGVVLNRIATPRHERVIREAIAAATGLPVLGALGVLRGEARLVSRHLGLVTADERSDREQALDRIAEAVGPSLELDAILAAAAGAGEREFPGVPAVPGGDPVRIGVVRDAAFSFYYPENLEELEARGAVLVPVSALADEPLPEVDAVYVGGGFPEVHVERLALARTFLGSLREAAGKGTPVYAECGGLMLLARTLEVEGRRHAMSGVLDLTVEQTVRPQGHGYAEGTVDRSNPFYAEGTAVRGHEFHYSRVVGGEDAERTAMALSKGTGVRSLRDGIARGSVWASYVHVHARTSDAWAYGLLAAARRRAAAAGAGAGEALGILERNR